MKAGPRRREPDADCRTPVDLDAANDGGDRSIHTLRKHGRSFKVIRSEEAFACSPSRTSTANAAREPTCRFSIK